MYISLLRSLNFVVVVYFFYIVVEINQVKITEEVLTDATHILTDIMGSGNTMESVHCIWTLSTIKRIMAELDASLLLSIKEMFASSQSWPSSSVLTCW